MKECPRCNAANPDDAAFCSGCGAMFEGASPPAIPELPAYPPPPGIPGCPPQPGQPPQAAPGYPSQPAAYTTYAGFWIRFAASFLDAVVISLAFLPVNIIFSAINHHIPIYFFLWGLWTWPKGVDTPILILFNLARLAILWGYFIIMTATSGATVGKKILKLRVVREDMGRVSWGTAAFRETIGKIISGLICGLGYIWAGFDARKQAWHDLMAKTFVIRFGP